MVELNRNPSEAGLVEAGNLTGSEDRVFVYGTLKQFESAAYMLKGCVRVVSGVSTKGVLIPSGGPGSFPCFLPDEVCKVYGEIYLVDKKTLQNLDRYEGVATGLYRRVMVNTGHGQAWIYMWGADRELKDHDQCIEFGRWGTHSRHIPYVQLRTYYEDQQSLYERGLANRGGIERDGRVDWGRHRSAGQVNGPVHIVTPSAPALVLEVRPAIDASVIVGVDP